MPLLKPPEPEIAKRKYYIRIVEPLALKMESYAEFLGAKTVDHVIAEALDFVFKKDTDFNKWLAEHGAVAQPRPRRLKAAPNGTGAAHDAPETKHATEGATI